MALSPGQRLDHYEIVSPLGAGGMGEVYAARDVRLGRRVAVKVLPAEVAGDPESLRRFQHEAHAVSALNHPNIVTLYDVGIADGVSYIASELVEGKTLSEQLFGGALSLKKGLDVGAQLADGLAAAHRAGIVHRDLKPGNVMLTRDGLIKILDFGLAKLTPRPSDSSAGSKTTLTMPETAAGRVMGTVGYMSPEQALGEPLDFRSDQFAFGAVLYEVLTGVRAFGRSTHIDTLSAILHDEPVPISRLQPGAPAPLEWIVERCLAKDPDRRYQSTQDLASDLRALKDHLGDVSEDRAAMRVPSRSRRLIRVATGVGMLVFGAVVWWLARRTMDRVEPEFRRLTFQSGIVSRALFVRNSNSILYTARWGGEPSASFLAHPDSPGLDRRLESEPQLPMAFSADGSQVLVLLGPTRAAIDVEGMLAWWPASGGQPRPVLDKAGWADWASRSRDLAVVRDLGGERVLELRPETGPTRTLFRTRGAISWVRFSPDEKRIAFIHHPSRLDDAGEVELVGAGGSPANVLTSRFERCVGLDWNPRTGEIWFTAARVTAYDISLWAVSPSGRLRSLYVLPEFFVLQGVSPSGDRTLLIQSENRVRLIVRRNSGPATDFSWLGFTMVGDISPDGKSLLFSDEGAAGNAAGMWVRPLAGGDAVPLGSGYMGRFSPDGRSVIAVTQARNGPLQLEIIPVGPGTARQLTSSNANHWLPSFAGSGTVLYASSEGGKNQIWRIELSGGVASSLGADGCDQPMANPRATAFLCVCGDAKDSLFVYPMRKGEGRKLYGLPVKGRFNYARWNGSGEQVFAVTGDRRFLTLDAGSGSLIREEPLPLPESGTYETFYGAAFTADASTQAYSVARSSSGLFLAGGIR